MRDLYSGPLYVAATSASPDHPGSVIMVGLAMRTDGPIDAPLVRVRIEMTAEDAEDLMRALPTMIEHAKRVG